MLTHRALGDPCRKPQHSRRKTIEWCQLVSDPHLVAYIIVWLQLDLDNLLSRDQGSYLQQMLNRTSTVGTVHFRLSIVVLFLIIFLPPLSTPRDLALFGVLRWRCLDVCVISVPLIYMLQHRYGSFCCRPFIVKLPCCAPRVLSEH
jgi:hypothetical protein